MTIEERENSNCGYQVRFGKESPCCYWRWTSAQRGSEFRTKHPGEKFVTTGPDSTQCVPGSMGRVCFGEES